MPLAPRPSDVHRLPPPPAASATGLLDPGPPPSQDPAARRPPRPPRWLTPVAVLLFLAILGGILLAPDGGVVGDGSQPLVDVATEDQTIAALHLYEAESVAMEELTARTDPYANPGPGEVQRIAVEGVEAVRSALGQAREVSAPGTLAESWWLDRDHDRLLAELSGLEQHAGFIAALTATHDSLYGGAGEVSVDEARASVAAIPAEAAASLVQWAGALRAELDGVGDGARARQVRELVGQEWAGRLATLRPVATGELASHLGQLSPRVLQGLGGHPVAGPGLRRLGVTG